MGGGARAVLAGRCARVRSFAFVLRVFCFPRRVSRGARAHGSPEQNGFYKPKTRRTVRGAYTRLPAVGVYCRRCENNARSSIEARSSYSGKTPGSLRNAIDHARPRRPPLLRRRGPRGRSGQGLLRRYHNQRSRHGVVLAPRRRRSEIRSHHRARPRRPLTGRRISRPTSRRCAGATAAPTIPTGSTTRATRASRGATTSPRSPPRSRSGARGASARTASRRWKPASGRAASARRRARTSTPYPEPVLPSPGVSPSYNCTITTRVARRGRAAE